MTSCVIEWNSLTLAEWEDYFSRIPRSYLLQSYGYARAAGSFYHQKPKWGLIRIDGTPTGLVQCMEAGIFGNLIHTILLDCGPAWLPGYGTEEHTLSFFAEFARQFPRRLGRARRIIPNMPDMQERMTALGFNKLSRPGYQTIWLDLDKDAETLKAAMKPNWRNKIGKAEKAGLRIEWDTKGQHLAWILRMYMQDRAIQQYQGPAPGLLKALATNLIPKGDFIIGVVKDGTEPVAGGIFLKHGRSATYQVGWSGARGREKAATNFLLWESVLMLKGLGVYDLDLGGINEDGAKNVKSFKEGMGGQPVTLAGHYL